MAIISKDNLDAFVGGCIALLVFVLFGVVLVGIIFLASFASSYSTVYEQNNCYEKTQSVTCYERKGLLSP